MSMAPKDGNIIKDGIAALLRGLVGSPGDTGGSTTAGTVMAKENTIIELSKKIADATGHKATFVVEHVMQSGDGNIAVFEFDRTVRFNFVEIKGTTSGVSKIGRIYFISGEISVSFEMEYFPTSLDQTITPMKTLATSAGSSKIIFSNYVNNESNKVQFSAEFTAKKIQIDFGFDVTGMQVRLCCTEL